MENELNPELEQEQLLTEVRAIRDILYKEGPMDAVHGRIQDFYNEVLVQMPESEEFEVMHLLKGSDPSDGKHKGDLPEPYSVIRFLKQLQEEYLNDPKRTEEWGRD